jgi:MtN3 and saliva related transmembrane protein
MNPPCAEWLGYVAAGLTTSAFVPQVVHTFRTRDLSGISLGMYIVLNLGIALWLAYGLITDDKPLMVANAITLVLAGSILAMKVQERVGRFRSARAG